MKNKQGMSAVVTTLIIILLVIVALGIIWVVVKNVIMSGKEQVEWAEKCRAVEITAVKIEGGDASDDYKVTLYRTGAGDAIAGVKLVFANGTAYSDVTEFGIVIGQLETKTETITGTGIDDVDELQITPYFEDDLGAEHLCETRIEEF